MDARDRDEAGKLASRMLDVLLSLETDIPETAIGGRTVQLTLNQARTLHLILVHPGINQKEIARVLAVTPAAVSVIVRKLREWGLVETRVNQSDRRAYELNLTAQGDQIYQLIREAQVKALAEMMKALPLDRQRVAVEALELAAATMKEKSP